MVHYDADAKPGAPTLPPTCPKCGSHRTEIVGREDDGRTITLRCNSCGERSTILTDRRASDADETTDEVEAIRTVACALARLPNAASRVRVLRWAAERFQIDATSTVPAVLPQPAAAPAADPMLSVDGLQEFFPAATSDGDQLTVNAGSVIADGATLMVGAEPAMIETPPIDEKPRVDGTPHFESMVHSFVEDFRRLASDWQTAIAAPGSTSR